MTYEPSSYEPSASLPADPPRRPPSGELPPVEPPTMGFILQLFVIPMVIVTIIVLIWLLFNWLAHMGSNPIELVSDLKRQDDSSWQKALTLADLLRNPRYVHLKKDPRLAQELASVLDGQMDAAGMDENSIRLRIFLCRALGEFQRPEVLPVLLRAAQTDRQGAEAEVRLSALQSLSVFIAYNGAEALRTHPELLDVLLEASRETTTGVDTRHTRGELRSHAAYALGILGGERAHDRLELMLGDAYPNARYNAAIGLARGGDPRAVPVLVEMLEPDNVEAVRSEEAEETKPWKRLKVLQNGLRATAQLAEKNAVADLAPLQEALDQLLRSDLSKLEPDVRRGVRIAAEEVQLTLKTRSKQPA